MRSGNRGIIYSATGAGQKPAVVHPAVITEIARVMAYITGMETKKMYWSAIISCLKECPDENKFP